MKSKNKHTVDVTELKAFILSTLISCGLLALSLYMWVNGRLW